MRLYVLENTGGYVYFTCMTEEQINEKLNDGSWDDFTIWNDVDVDFGSGCNKEVYWEDNIPPFSVFIIQGRGCDTIKEGETLRLNTPMKPIIDKDEILAFKIREEEMEKVQKTQFDEGDGEEILNILNKLDEASVEINKLVLQNNGEYK